MADTSSSAPASSGTAPAPPVAGGVHSDAALELAPDIGAIGGQALIEGVMMRRADHWGAAVRCDDGSVKTTAEELKDLGIWRKIPLARGAIALVESMTVGMRALLWAASERATEEEQAPTRVGLALSAVIAIVLSLAVFGVGPAAVAHWVGPKSSVLFNLAEGAVRLALLFGYLLLLSASSEVRRTFEYHGAEHMTIHALEHGLALTPDNIRRFDRRHPRCGTSFLVVTVIVAVVVFTFLGRPSLPWLIVSRIVLLPVVAGLSYEAIRFAGNHRHSWYGKVLMVPGNLVQRITTRPPSDDQIQVAVEALYAVLAVSPVPGLVLPAHGPTTPPPASASGPTRDTPAPPAVEPAVSPPT